MSEEDQIDAAIDTVITDRPWRAEVRAHKHSIWHREEIEQSSVCGCFYCLEQFPAGTIKEWIDEDRPGHGRTAMCPHCGIDAVIGSESGYPITEVFLAAMHAVWFAVEYFDPE